MPLFINNIITPGQELTIISGIFKYWTTDWGKRQRRLEADQYTRPAHTCSIQSQAQHYECCCLGFVCGAEIDCEASNPHILQKLEGGQPETGFAQWWESCRSVRVFPADKSRGNQRLERKSSRVLRVRYIMQCQMYYIYMYHEMYL